MITIKSSTNYIIQWFLFTPGQAIFDNNTCKRMNLITVIQLSGRHLNLNTNKDVNCKFVQLFAGLHQNTKKLEQKRVNQTRDKNGVDFLSGLNIEHAHRPPQNVVRPFFSFSLQSKKYTTI